MTPAPDTLTDVGKLIGGALLVGGGAWGILRKFASDRRNDAVADARAGVDAASFDAYDRTITMLRADVEKIRADKEAADAKWRADMAQLEARLKDVSTQADTAIERARQAELQADKLRAQLRALNVEPCV
jgi:hypothetical protein